MTSEMQRDVIVTGVREVDNKLGGGIPLGSLGLIEGHPDAGKSVLAQHLTYGALALGQMCVAYYTTENTVKSLVEQMDSLALSTLDYLLTDRLRIYPLSLRARLKNTRKPFRDLVEHFMDLPERFQVIVVDSLTVLVAHSNPVPLIDFFWACKDLCNVGRSILLVVHSHAFDVDLLSRITSLCDAHLRLRLEQVGDRFVKIMEVLKVRGADKPTGEIVSFEIEPKVGMRIIPLAKARV